MSDGRLIIIQGGKKDVLSAGDFLVDSAGLPLERCLYKMFYPPFPAVRVSTGGSLSISEGSDTFMNKKATYVGVASSDSSLEHVDFSIQDTLPSNFKNWGTNKIRVYAACESRDSADNKLVVKAYRNGVIAKQVTQTINRTGWGNSTLDATMDNLVHAYKMDETLAAAQRVDMIEGVNLIPMATGSPPSTSGSIAVATGGDAKFTAAADFYNSGNNVLYKTAGALIPGLSEMTMAFWFFWRASHPSNEYILSENYSSYYDWRWQVYTYSNRNMYTKFGVPYSGSYSMNLTSTSSSFVENAWNLFICTMDINTGSTHYTNHYIGDPTTHKGQATYTGAGYTGFDSGVSNPGLSSGGSSYGTNYKCTGKLCEVLIWNKILSQTERLALWNSNTGREIYAGTEYITVDPTDGGSVTWNPDDDLLITVECYSKDSKVVKLQKIEVDMTGV